MLRAILLWLGLTVAATAATPTIDAPSQADAIATSGTSKTITLTTAAANEVAFLFVISETVGTPFSTSVSDGTNSWLTRKTVANTNPGWGLGSGGPSYARAEIWYAKIPVAGTYTVTVTLTSTMDALAMTIVAYSGVAAQIWDTNVSLPATQVLATNSAQLLTVNTTQAHDVILGFSSTTSDRSNPGTIDTGTGWLPGFGTWTDNTNFASFQAEINPGVVGPLSAYTVHFGDGNATSGSNATFIVDAFTGDVPSTGAANFFHVPP